MTIFKFLKKLLFLQTKLLHSQVNMLIEHLFMSRTHTIQLVTAQNIVAHLFISSVKI